MHSQHTISCGKRHRLEDGAPVAHPCRVLAPADLDAERREGHALAVDALEAMALVLAPGRA